jgi:squalene-hopene/tetraprenyl-beta-curcumene cyclase
MKTILRTATTLGTLILATWLGVRLFPAAFAVPPASTSWNPKAAAAYLDQRAEWWIAWHGATRDQGTFCVSCHTALAYALSRPALRAALGEKTPSANERRILDNVTKRVRGWRQMKPFYDDRSGANKSLQSRGTESVLNALILANSDAGSGKLSEDTRAAFRNMWALQETAGNEKGAWPWLDFQNAPFEASDSLFYGACLAAVAVGTAPEGFRSNPDIQDNVKLLRDYLDREYASQSLINQVDLLWASAKLPGLLAPKQQASIIDEVLGKQQADGGWSLSSLSWTWSGSSLKSLVKLWTRSENTPFDGKSDGYATGLIVFALEQAGLPRENVQLQRGLAWLVRNQNTSEGRWPGYSLNHGPAPSSPTGLFMSDSATAFAVLALTGAE